MTTSLLEAAKAAYENLYEARYAIQNEWGDPMTNKGWAEFVATADPELEDDVAQIRQLGDAIRALDPNWKPEAGSTVMLKKPPD